MTATPVAAPGDVPPPTETSGKSRVNVTLVPFRDDGSSTASGDRIFGTK